MGTLDTAIQHPLNREVASLDGSDDFTLNATFVNTVPFIEYRLPNGQLFTDRKTFREKRVFNR